MSPSVAADPGVLSWFFPVDFSGLSCFSAAFAAAAAAASRFTPVADVFFVTSAFGEPTWALASVAAVTSVVAPSPVGSSAFGSSAAASIGTISWSFALESPGVGVSVADAAARAALPRAAVARPVLAEATAGRGSATS
ncbi:hypothetical protein [Frankia sp. AgW1.1]|uniref:hypothetical protein n=1 Tax=Frankia sp. AgW1.1 TaxID=1836971 RepID=UPI001933F2CD|nr:hypothetical protein [Frankia sp. AgW1.1]MBL7491279.1 hypothetical protein [Frankia sp. AgW1.1]